MHCKVEDYDIDSHVMISDCIDASLSDQTVACAYMLYIAFSTYVAHLP